ncbi:MAG: dethiobiotin synthetase [Alphaproteobacteria bacterium]|jgi:dethiobiotin synthetase
MRTYFVSGTDTDVGKTVASVLLLKSLTKISERTLGIKPISAGCEITPFGLRNEDALKLQAASGIKVDYETINPIAYAPFIAPHIAAQQQGDSLTLGQLQDCLDKARMLKPKWLLVEGAGGWRLPLNNEGLFYSDFALQNHCKVILVVGMKLGCLNHAVLTHEAVVSDGLTCVGWVANQLSDDMPCYAENLDTLRALLPCPLIAEIPYQKAPIDTIKLSEAFLEVFR